MEVVPVDVVRLPHHLASVLRGLFHQGEQTVVVGGDHLDRLLEAVSGAVKS